MDPNDIVIEQVKTYSEEIAQAVNVFVAKLGDNYQHFTEDSLREIVNSKQSYLFIAKHLPTQEIAGMVFEIIYRIPYTTKAYIEDLFIDEKFRKMGIATRLFQKVVENAKEKKAAYIDFTSKPERIEGNSLYAKLGFKQRETNVYRLKFTYEAV